MLRRGGASCCYHLGMARRGSSGPKGTDARWLRERKPALLAVIRTREGGMAGWRRPGVACGARGADGDEEVQASCCYHAAEPEEEVQWSACSDNPCKRSTEAGVVTCGTSGACGVFTHTS